MKINKKIITAVGAVAVAGVAAGACGSAAPSTQPTHTTEPPATTAPASPKPAPPAPKPQAQVHVWSGSGSWNSPEFKVGKTITVRYSYWNNTSGYGGDNFIADIENSGDIQPIANEIAVSGGKTTTLYPNSAFGGSNVYHLMVQATGPWKFIITTTP